MPNSRLFGVQGETESGQLVMLALIASTRASAIHVIEYVIDYGTIPTV